MNLESFMSGKIYEIFNWIYKMMMINILWLLTTMVGLGLFTFMPATVTVYIMIKSIIKNEDVPILKTFFLIFKKEYIKSQKLFLLLFLIGFILFFNIYFYLQNMGSGFISTVGSILSMMAIIIYMIIYINIFLVYIHYPHVKVFKTLKLTFLISMLYAFKSILVIIVYGIIFALIIYVDVLIPLTPLFIMSFLAYVSLMLMGDNYSRLIKDQEILTAKRYLK